MKKLATEHNIDTVHIIPVHSLENNWFIDCHLIRHVFYLGHGWTGPVDVISQLNVVLIHSIPIVSHRLVSFFVQITNKFLFSLMIAKIT